MSTTMRKINVSPNRVMVTRATIRMFSAGLSVEEKEAEYQLQRIETFKKFKQQPCKLWCIWRILLVSPGTTIIIIIDSLWINDFLSLSVLPTTMTDVMGVPVLGEKLKNVAELAVFNGMPTEHANRSVSITQCTNSFPSPFLGSYQSITDNLNMALFASKPIFKLRYHHLRNFCAS